MGEPEAVHPFSSQFRSQLSNVLSRPTMVSHIKQISDEKIYLETEIDSYSGVEFDKCHTTNGSNRPPPPPKPVKQIFTFDKSNPFLNMSNEDSTLSLPRYAQVNKPKIRPKIPPKPQIRTKVTNTSTLPHSQKLDEPAKISKEDYFFRVNSLPNLTPEHEKDARASGNFIKIDCQSSSTPGYDQLNRQRQSFESNASEYHVAQEDTDYCDVISEGSPTVINWSATSQGDSHYENIYEDVNTRETASKVEKLQPSSDIHEGSDSDYTLMSSPVSEIRFPLDRQSFYQNCSMVHPPESDILHMNEYENIGSPFPLGDPNIVGLPEQARKPQTAHTAVSSTSSFDDQDSSVYSVQSSMPSTTASSFQRMQVCFFPPSPPPEFYQNGIAVVESPGSATSGSSVRSRSSRSRIPVPIKPKSKDPGKKIISSSPEVSHQHLPPAPAPPSSTCSTTSLKNANQGELHTPPINESAPNGRAFTSSGRGARWYEKLGCIQTDTIRPSEPYGRPGERKRSKSLNREQQRRSQFFLPVEPITSDPPNVQPS